MPPIRAAAAMLLTLVGCASHADDEISPFVQSDKADGGPKKLHTLERTKIDVDEPSDLTMIDGTLYTVSDSHSKIYAIDEGGGADEYLDVEGKDLEALAFDPDRGELLYAGENRAVIWHVGSDGERYDPIDVEDALDGDSGIEGLAFAEGHLFVAKERSPARIYELDEQGEIVRREKIGFADDLSALAWSDGKLYALSDQQHALFRLDEDFEVELAWKLPIEHPEGVVVDGDAIYVVSDSEEKLYTFELLD